LLEENAEILRRIAEQ